MEKGGFIFQGRFVESLIKLEREGKKGRLVEGKKGGNVVRGEGRVLQPSLHFESIERKVEKKETRKERETWTMQLDDRCRCKCKLTCNRHDTFAVS